VEVQNYQWRIYLWRSSKNLNGYQKLCIKSKTYTFPFISISCKLHRYQSIVEGVQIKNSKKVGKP
jgi:hypothetical protein